MGGGVRGRRQSCRCFVVRGVALLVHSCSMESIACAAFVGITLRGMT
jgi:hypothetical protein